MFKLKSLLLFSILSGINFFYLATAKTTNTHNILHSEIEAFTNPNSLKQFQTSKNSQINL